MPTDPPSNDSRPAPQRRIDRILDAAFLDDLSARSVDEVRAMKAECEEVETEYSYVRRLAQGRIDILVAEVERREAGGSLGDLVDALPRILADSGPRAPVAQSRLSAQLAPSMEIEWRRGLERLVSDATLANLPLLSDAELAEALEQLRELEAQTSATRRSLHEVIDVVERELAQRLAVGQA
jgi:hypothetical protein